MRVVVSGPVLEMHGAKSGMLVDYADISRIVRPVVEMYLDHHYLNESIPSLANPTSEMLAAWLFHLLKPLLPNLDAVEVDETCTSSCCYFGP